ncbi:MAG: InlB B-repeat-containing protein [Oscillospiraceae bacterium]|nr:InlB B-repeat-containing protein [Oscillospiraceae bacterium]
MKKHISARIVSFLLAMILIFAASPLSTFGAASQNGAETASSGNSVSDIYWQLFVKPFLKPAADAEGLPENAKLSLEIISNPFSRKNGSGNYNFLDFYDIKAVDKQSGKEIHPVGEVEVTITDARIKEGQSVYILHVLDDENVIRDTSNYVLKTDSAFISAFPAAAKAAKKALGINGVAVEIIDDLVVDGTSITFKTSSFSIFAISENPILTVNFYKGPKTDANSKIVSIRVKKSDAEGYPSTENPPVETEFEKILYDPGVNAGLDANILFRGWFESNTYDASDAVRVTEPEDDPNGAYVSGSMTIQDVRDKVAEILNAENFNGGEKDFYAMLYKQFVVTYFDQTGKICLGRDFAMQRAYSETGVETELTELDYQVTLTYVPYGQFENFEGWKLKTGDKDNNDGYYTAQAQHMVGIYTTTPPDGTPEITGEEARNHIYTTPTWTRISGNIYLQAESPEGNWLVFNENGKGATYVAPQFVKKGENTVNPSDYETPVEMQRHGYRFDGWYLPSGYEQALDENNQPVYDENNQPVYDTSKPLKDAAGNVILGELFVFGDPLDDNVTVYAKWVPAESATYTVVVWVEKSADTYENNVTSGARQYDFYDSFNFVGSTNQVITAVSDATSSVTDIDGTYSNARIRGTYANGQALDRTIAITGYHRNTEKTQLSVNVVPEGTSVINVYYDRNTVRYTFYYPYGAASSAYEVYTGNSAGQYYIKNGDDYEGPYYMTYSNGVWTYETGEYVYTPYTGTENGSYYIDVDGEKEPATLTRVGDTWTYQTTVTGYHLTNSTSNGNYYISDGNGGYRQVYLTRSGNVWTYDTGEDEYVESNSTSSGYYYIPDGNGGYRRVYLNRSGSAWTINGEYDYIYTPQQNADNYSGNSGNNVTNPYGSDDGVNFYPIYWGREYSVYGTRAFWKTQTWYGYSDRYHGMVYSREQINRPYSGPIYVQSDILAIVTEAYEYGPYQVSEVYEGTVYTRDPITENYSGDVYVPAAGGNAWRLYYQQTGLYGEDLNWPTDTGIWWYPNGSSTGGTSGTRLTYKSDLLPLTSNMDVVYYGSRNTGNSEIRFYTQDLSGGDNYTLQMTVSSNGGNFNINDKFTGFEAYQYRSYTTGYGGGSWSSWQNVGTLNTGTGIYGSSVAVNSILEIRFRRQSNKIVYLDGQYVNGNMIPQNETRNPDAFDESEDMFVGVDLTSYNADGENYYVPEPYHEEYVFAGWYADDACTQPYTFSTMQLTGVTVYAKWVQEQFRVFLHPNAGTVVYDEDWNVVSDTRDPSLDWGSESQAMNFRISYDGTVSVPTGLRDSYIFAGWYTDPGLTQSFIPATRLNEQTVTAAYNKETDLTDYMDKWGVVSPGEGGEEPYNSDLVGYNGGDRFWINKKYDLYAKWRSKIVGADGMYLKFVTTDDEGRVGHFASGTANVNSDRTEYFDGELYTDAAFAYGLAACDAPAVAEGANELNFRYWVVQRWSASEGFFDATDDDGNLIVIYPGQRFETVYEYAQRVDLQPGDEGYNKVGEEGYDPDLPEHYYNYYMVLRAEYTEAVPQTTTLVYDANGGTFVSDEIPSGYTAGTSGDYNTVTLEGLLVNEAFDILPGTVVTREGYNFVGWSLERDGDKFLDGGEENYAADNLSADPTGNDESNTLYALWEIKTYKVVVKKEIFNYGVADTSWDDHGFAFHYSVTDGGDYNVADALVETNGVSVTNSASGDIVIENVPYGSTLSVWEVLTNAESADFTTNHDADNKVQITLTGMEVEEDEETLKQQVVITNTRVTGKIVISKEVSDKNGTEFSTERFIFKFERLESASSTDVDDSFVPVYITLGDGQSASVSVPAGYYKVTEVTEWSWRYDAVDDVTEIVCTIDKENTLVSADFTNKRNTQNWLSGENSTDNPFIVNGR